MGVNLHFIYIQIFFRFFRSSSFFLLCQDKSNFRQNLSFLNTIHKNFYFIFSYLLFLQHVFFFVNIYIHFIHNWFYILAPKMFLQKNPSLTFLLWQVVKHFSRRLLLCKISQFNMFCKMLQDGKDIYQSFKKTEFFVKKEEFSSLLQ